MKVLISVIAIIFSNKIGQNLLELIAKGANLLMGIGLGTGVDSSGEKVIFKKLIASNSNDKSHLIVFDIGANKGQFLNLANSSLQQYKNFSIHSFEPSKFTYNILTENAPKGENIVLNNFGMGVKESILTLYYDELASGLASLTKRELGFINRDFNKSEQVFIKTVDDYCTANKISKIDLLKIDVEGHELDVLLGARRMIEERRVDMISFEFGGCNIDTRTYFKDFYDFFTRHDFKIFRITPSGYLYLIENYKEMNEQFRTTNFLSISNGVSL
jgi:FkbM family methyltransferase